MFRLLTTLRASRGVGLKGVHKIMSPMDMQDWIDLWNHGETPWDLGGVHPATGILWSKWQQLSGKKPPEITVLMPGAGSAYDAEIFLDSGALVVAIDLSQKAQKKAVAAFASFDKFQYEVGDMFHWQPKYPFDVIYDRAVFCAFDQVERARYVAYCADILAPDGWLLSPAAVREHGVAENPHNKHGMPPYYLPVNQVISEYQAASGGKFQLRWLAPLAKEENKEEKVISDHPYGLVMMIWQKSPYL